MTRLYKYNMSIIWSVEKSSFGKNSYYRLVENGLFKMPEFEGDYIGQAPYSNTEDEDDNGATGDNDVSGDKDNMREYSDPENMMDGIKSGIKSGGNSGEESDSGSESRDDREE